MKFESCQFFWRRGLKKSVVYTEQQQKAKHCGIYESTKSNCDADYNELQNKSVSDLNLLLSSTESLVGGMDFTFLSFHLDFKLFFVLRDCGLPLRWFVRRYYAICCQPLVYRNKMTPMRVALMIGGCWVIPTFISFLPIMQGWNSIGIDHLVSAPLWLHV